MTIGTLTFDASRYLRGDDAAQREMLADALASGSEQYIRNALRTVIKARRAEQLAGESGAQAFGEHEQGDEPDLAALVALLGELEMQLTAQVK